MADPHPSTSAEPAAPSRAPGSPAAGGPGLRIGRILALNACFCVLIAAGITVGEGGDWSAFPKILLFSECIGMSIALTAFALRRLPAIRGLPPGRGMMLTIPIAGPFGYVFGHVLASTLLGVPFSFRQITQDHRTGLLSTLIASAFWIYYSWSMQRIAHEATSRAEAQRLAAEAQLRLLRAQLEPHMLFNTLANLRALMEEDVRGAQRMVDQLIVYLRGTLQASRTEAAPLRQEFAQLQAYLGLMEVRMGPRLQLRFDLPDALATLPVPTMLLQPLVENAIKHGLEPQVQGGELSVSARRDGEVLELTVADTGRGLPEGQRELAAPADDDAAVNRADADHSRYGLVHVQRRLAALYGRSASMRIEAQAPRGVRAVVRLPLPPSADATLPPAVASSPATPTTLSTTPR